MAVRNDLSMETKSDLVNYNSAGGDAFKYLKSQWKEINLYAKLDNGLDNIVDRTRMWS